MKRVIPFIAISLFLLLNSCQTSKTKETETWVSAQGPLRLNKATSCLADMNGNDIHNLFDFRTLPDNQVLAFPIKPLECDVIVGVEEKNSKIDAKFHSRVRSACVLYIKEYQWGDGINKICPGEAESLLTPEQVSIVDYSVSFSGETVLYSHKNALGGTDIWSIGREGKNNHLLIECRGNICGNPTLSPDEQAMVFSKTVISNTPTVVLQMGDTKIQLDDVQISQHSQFSWSWSGRFISYTNKYGNIEIFNVENQRLVKDLLPEKSVGNWAKYSDEMIISYPIFWGGIPNMQVDSYNLRSGEVRKVTGGGTEPIEFGLPNMFYPTKSVIIPFRLQSGGYSMQLCHVNSEGHCKPITNEQNLSYSPFGFDPSGRYFLYQSFEIGKSDGISQVGLWDEQNSEHLILARNARNPQWLP